MRGSSRTLLCAVLVTLAIGCGKKAEENKGGGPDSATTPTPTPGQDGALKIEGTYLLTQMDFGGVNLLKGNEPEAERLFKITGDKMFNSKDGKEDPHPTTYKIDGSKTPAHIDLTEQAGTKEMKLYGIAKLDGDTLTLCLAESPETRPTTFASGKGNTMWVMQRKK